VRPHREVRCTGFACCLLCLFLCLVVVCLVAVVCLLVFVWFVGSLVWLLTICLFLFVVLFHSWFVSVRPEREVQFVTDCWFVCLLLGCSCVLACLFVCLLVCVFVALLFV